MLYSTSEKERKRALSKRGEKNRSHCNSLFSSRGERGEVLEKENSPSTNEGTYE